jgi:hypothetical protein
MNVTATINETAKAKTRRLNRRAARRLHGSFFSSVETPIPIRDWAGFSRSFMVAYLVRLVVEQVRIPMASRAADLTSNVAGPQ